MEKIKNAVSWFEIPAADFERAKEFYETIFDYEMHTMEVGPVTLGYLPYDPGAGGIGGAIAAGEGYAPTLAGALIYLNGGADLSVVLDRIEEAGGEVVMSKNLISEDVGYMALFVDTEGNSVALHSVG